ncbi:MAG: Rieske 2Fe-2S domain-containing protein, partial [Acidimicrobiaceae bacterium]|nr:Rieske 2Fe-2S domain-containing protein [Acidimicrobiaceae bacterium]
MIADLEHEPVVERLRRRVGETSGLVDAPLDSPMLQPYEVYDQDLFDLEMVRVYARSWVWLGDTEDLVEPGDFITGTIGYQPVMVIRQEDGSVRGFLNNCRHRASGLLYEPAGNCGKT